MMPQEPTVKSRLAAVERWQKWEDERRANDRQLAFEERQRRDLRNRGFAYGAAIATMLCIVAAAVASAVLS